MESRTTRFLKRALFTGLLCLAAGLFAINCFNPSPVEAEAMSYEGYLADVLCATRGTALDGADMLKHPEKHSVGCLKEPPCVASGYGVLTKGMGDTYTFHKFDKKGNELAAELIKKTQKKDSFAVKVTGDEKEGVVSVKSIAEK